MQLEILEALGLRVYVIPDFHMNGALVTDLGAVLLREGLSSTDVASVVAKVVDHLLLPSGTQPLIA